MTLYKLINGCTVQGNIILDGFYDDGKKSTTVFMERDVDDLEYRLPSAIEDCDVTYIFCDSNGWMHIEFNAPERLRVQDFYADDWVGGNLEIGDDGLIVNFSELFELSIGWGKEVYELLEECEEV